MNCWKEKKVEKSKIGLALDAIAVKIIFSYIDHIYNITDGNYVSLKTNAALDDHLILVNDAQVLILTLILSPLKCSLMWPDHFLPLYVGCKITSFLDLSILHDPSSVMHFKKADTFPAHSLKKICLATQGVKATINQ